MNQIKSNRAKQIVVWSMAVGILLPASIGFAAKIFRFVQTLRGEDGVEFALIPLTNYFLAAMGFACLLVWAIIHGMFRDIERPKYDMLSREDSLEEAERRSHS